jgi:DNA polymerase III epsilon subunit-like protein
MLFLDIETTGLPEQPNKNIYYNYKDCDKYDKSRVIQFCMQLYDDERRLVSELYEYIKVDFEIPEDSIKIHKITNRDCEEMGKKFGDIYSRMYYLLQNTKIIIGHNINFDVSVLASELYRNRLESLASMLFYKKRFCTMKEASNYGIKKYRPRLMELYNILFNKDFEGAHDAKSDVIACKECFYKMIENIN